MSRSERASPGGSTALSERWTVRSTLVKQPVFSPQIAAGSTTSASAAVSVRKASCTTTNSPSLREDLADAVQLGQRDGRVGGLDPQELDRAFFGVAEDLHRVRGRRPVGDDVADRRSRAGPARRCARGCPSCGTPANRRRRRTRGCSAPWAGRSSGRGRSRAGPASRESGAGCSPGRQRPSPASTGRLPEGPSRPATAPRRESRPLPATDSAATPVTSSTRSGGQRRTVSAR